MTKLFTKEEICNIVQSAASTCDAVATPWQKAGLVEAVSQLCETAAPVAHPISLSAIAEEMCELYVTAFELDGTDYKVVDRFSGDNVVRLIGFNDVQMKVVEIKNQHITRTQSHIQAKTARIPVHTTDGVPCVLTFSSYYLVDNEGNSVYLSNVHNFGGKLDTITIGKCTFPITNVRVVRSNEIEITYRVGNGTFKVPVSDMFVDGVGEAQAVDVVDEDGYPVKTAYIYISRVDDQEAKEEPATPWPIYLSEIVDGTAYRNDLVFDKLAYNGQIFVIRHAELVCEQLNITIRFTLGADDVDVMLAIDVQNGIVNDRTLAADTFTRSGLNPVTVNVRVVTPPTP